MAVQTQTGRRQRLAKLLRKAMRDLPDSDPGLTDIRRAFADIPAA